MNLNAFCSRFPTAEKSLSRSAYTARSFSTSQTLNLRPRARASSDAEIVISVTKSASEIRCGRGAIPAVTRTSESAPIY